MKFIFSILLVVLTSTSLFSQYWYVFENEDTLHYNGVNVEVRSMYNDNDNTLYVGGFFKDGGTTQLNCIGAWDGNNWQNLGSGLSNTWRVYCILKYKGNIYIGGTFHEAGFVPNTKYIAMYDGSNWNSLNNSYGEPSMQLRNMTLFNNMLIFGGTFSSIGSSSFNSIAGYDETDYIHLGNGIPDTDFTAIEYNGELYAGGLWPSVEKYNDSLNSWEMVGGYANYYIQDMVVDTINNFLYVGGGFTIVDDTIVTDNVAIWDGFRWSKVGYSNGILSSVMAIELYRGDIYAGLGGIDEIGGVFTGHIARWDGQDWHMVGDSVGWVVNDMKIFRDTLYVGGGSAYEPYDETRGVLAKWYMPPDTTCKYLKPRVQTYEDIFDLSGGTVNVQFYNNNAYVQTWAWDFDDTGTASIKDPLHTYTDTGTYNVCVTVNDTGCIKTACKNIVVRNPTSIKELNNEETGFKLYPNPTNKSLTLALSKGEGTFKDFGDIKILDVKGYIVKTIMTKQIKNQVSVTIDISELAIGVYFVKIGKKTEQFVKK